MAHLIQLSPPDHRLSQSLLDAPGGFVWWYAQVLNENGDGAVLIWSWGLPFLPGYASADRRGQAQTPRSRPSFNIAIYKGGQPDFYLLQEFEEGDAHWDGQNEWTFGRSRFQSKVVDGRRIVDVSLDCDVPGELRLTGTFSLEGVARKEGSNEVVDRQHDWSPLVGPSTARLNASIGTRQFNIEGRGYHDRNGGEVPMHRLGIKNWLWGQVPLPDRERIYYLLWPQAGEAVVMGLDVFEDGRTEMFHDLDVELGPMRWSYTGSRFPVSLKIRRQGKLWLDIDHRDIVDEGPFYLRWQIIAKTLEHTARGIAEYVIPDAIDTDFMRPLVRMRVHHTRRDNSIWLPLFTGPAEGRVKRLVQTWVSR